MEEVAKSFWAWWALVIVWAGILFWIGQAIDKTSVMAQAATVIVFALFFALVFGSMQWLHYMQVWPFIPQ
jgi:FtsH-binding integral membrane protein